MSLTDNDLSTGYFPVLVKCITIYIYIYTRMYIKDIIRTTSWHLYNLVLLAGVHHFYRYTFFVFRLKVLERWSSNLENEERSMNPFPTFPTTPPSPASRKGPTWPSSQPCNPFGQVYPPCRPCPP